MISEHCPGGKFQTKSKAKRSTGKFRVGRNAEEERLHQLSCEYWKSPLTRQRLGLPNDETIKRATLHVDRSPAVQLACAAYRAQRKLLREQRRQSKLKKWVKALPVDDAMTPVARAVAQEFKMDWARLFDGGRNPQMVEVRQAAMALLMEQRKWNLSVVAGYFGKKDHSTVSYAMKQVANRCSIEPQYAALIAAARMKIKSEKKTNLAQP